MTHIEDLVQSTTRALAGTVDAVRPLPALPQAPSLDEVSRRRGRRRATGSWLIPLAAAASVMLIVAAAVFAAQLAGPTRRQNATAPTAGAPRPEFYMTATYPATGPNVLQFQVRRTAGGAVTASTSIPAANMGWGNNITAAAGDRAFFIGHYPCRRSTAAAVTTFYRITITGSGQIRGIAAVGRPVQGMLTELAVSPDGSQMAYTALPGSCGSAKPRSAAAGTVSILDLSTGAVRTWQNTTGHQTVGGLSWAPDGRTLIIDEYSRTPGGPDLTVFGLNTTSGSGSLQAHSTTLLQQGRDCTGSTCVAAAVAGPDDSMTALEFQTAGQQTRVLVASIPLAAGKPQTVLYSELSDRSKASSVDSTGIFADPSGQWVLVWPTGAYSPPTHQAIAVGWISGGRLHPLPGVAKVFPQGIAW